MSSQDWNARGHDPQKIQPSMQVLIPFPFKAAKDRPNDWKMDLKARTYGNFADIMIPEFESTTLKIKHYPIMCLFALARNFRMFIHKWREVKQTSGILVLPIGWADHFTLSRIASWILKFCEEPDDHSFYGPLVLKITNLSQAIKTYVTLKHLGMDSAAQSAEAAVLNFLPRGTLNANCIYTLFASYRVHSDDILEAIAKKLVDLRHRNIIPESQAVAIYQFLEEKDTGFVKALLTIERMTYTHLQLVEVNQKNYPDLFAKEAIILPNGCKPYNYD